MTLNASITEFGPMALIMRYSKYTYMKLNTIYYKGVIEDAVH